MFEKKESTLDDDINLSLDQTELLAQEIRRGLHYPAIRVDGTAKYNELYSFLDKLRVIFKWDTYEKDTLGFYNSKTQKYSKLAHYTFVLNQWVSGMGLNILSEITASPFGFLLYFDPPDGFSPKGIDITPMADCGYEVIATIEFPFRFLEMNTFLPGDYRTKEEIERKIKESNF